MVLYFIGQIQNDWHMNYSQEVLKVQSQDVGIQSMLTVNEGRWEHSVRNTYRSF